VRLEVLQYIIVEVPAFEVPYTKKMLKRRKTHEQSVRHYGVALLRLRRRNQQVHRSARVGLVQCKASDYTYRRDRTMHMDVIDEIGRKLYDLIICIALVCHSLSLLAAIAMK
jgi:hypothetical protein